MKQILPIIVISLLLAGCNPRPAPASPAEIAYKTLATVAHTVDASMKGWADFVVAGLATPEGEAKVEAMYENYQIHAKLAAEQASQLGTRTEAGDLDTALSAVEAAAAQLTLFISQTQKKAKQ